MVEPRAKDLQGNCKAEIKMKGLAALRQKQSKRKLLWAFVYQPYFFSLSLMSATKDNWMIIPSDRTGEDICHRG